MVIGNNSRHISRPTHAHNAFTLIELLVVVSIIALLVAILLPALVKSRVTAKKTQCAMNCQQVATATIGYGADRRGQTPPSKYDLGEGIGGAYAIYQAGFDKYPDFGRWRRVGPLVAQGYLDNPSAIYCPAITELHGWLRPGGIDGYFCGYVEPDPVTGALPPGLSIMVFSYHYRESYYDDALGDYRTLNIDKDDPDQVIYADGFSAPPRS